jgi:hypothetical protein
MTVHDPDIIEHLLVFPGPILQHPTYVQSHNSVSVPIILGTDTEFLTKFHVCSAYWSLNSVSVPNLRCASSHTTFFGLEARSDVVTGLE